MKWTKFIPACFSILVMLFSPATADDDAGPNAVAEINQAINTVRTGSTYDARATAAVRLASIISKADPKQIDDKTLRELMSLLDSPDGWIQIYVAGSLGSFGPRAKAALPKLRRLLPKAHCSGSGLNPKTIIRIATARIHGMPLPPPKELYSCDTQPSDKPNF